MTKITITKNVQFLFLSQIIAKFVKNNEMGKHLNSVYTSIYDWIMTHGEGKIYFLSDFNSYEPDSVRQTFVRLVNDGVVIRLSPGIFLFPVKTRFGIAYPSDYEIAKEIARRDSASVLPSGMTAANMVGLSEQVPMKSVFLTDGAARIICVNGRDIIFKRGVPKNFAYKSKTMPLIVAGMKAMGKENITTEGLEAIKRLLGKEAISDLDSLCSDILLAPEWIRKIISPILMSIKG